MVRISTAKKYLPSLLLQANLGVEKIRYQSVFSEVMPFAQFNFSNVLIAGLEYSFNIYKALSLDVGVQVPLISVNFKTLKVLNPGIRLAQQRSYGFDYNLHQIFKPALRFGVSYKL
ncbi:MAG: hypothetical protein ACPGLV_18425 [Bacteroidia bacterium]